jgi:hypothetical protein
MLVPKAAVDENNFPTTGENNVGFTWKILLVQTETITHLKEQAAYDLFWAGINAANASHVFTSTLSANFVQRVPPFCGRETYSRASTPEFGK